MIQLNDLSNENGISYSIATDKPLNDAIPWTFIVVTVEELKKLKELIDEKLRDLGK